MALLFFRNTITDKVHWTFVFSTVDIKPLSNKKYTVFETKAKQIQTRNEHAPEVGRRVISKYSHITDHTQGNMQLTRKMRMYSTALRNIPAHLTRAWDIENRAPGDPFDLFYCQHFTRSALLNLWLERVALSNCSDILDARPSFTCFNMFIRTCWLSPLSGKYANQNFVISEFASEEVLVYQTRNSTFIT